MGRHVGEGYLAHDEYVVATADGVGATEDRLEDAIRGTAWALVGGPTVEAPDGQLVAIGNDFRL